MKSYAIIHGSFGNPFENWYKWAHDQLLSREETKCCFVPHFPSPHNQTFETWERLFSGYEDIGALDEGSTVIAHSSGCVFAAKYLVRHERKIGKFVSVSGFNEFLSGDDDFDKINKPFFLPETELAKIATLVAERHAFYSDDDPYLPQEKLKRFANTIGAREHVIEGGGHLNDSSGFSSFSALMSVL